MGFFDANEVFFTVPYFDYAMSYLEFFGTLLTLLSVVLVARRNIWNWPVGIAGVILFGILFYQIQLYADFFEQIYYFGASVVGWVLWHQVRKDVTVTKLSRNEWFATIGVCVGGSIAASWFLLNIHTLLPGLFPDPASFAVVDATTTVVSFTAQFLLVRRKVENWLLWIGVDVVAIWLYWEKDVPFISLLYVCFLCIATYGYFNYRRKERTGEAA